MENSRLIGPGSTGASTGVLIGGSTGSVKAQPEIDRVMDEISTEIDVLAKTVSELSERLTSVIIHQPEASPSADQATTSRFGCALACSLDAKLEYIRNNRQRLQNVIAALQL